MSETESDQTMSKFRAKWLAGATLVGGIVIGVIPALIFGALPAPGGSIDIWWPMVLGGAAVGATGAVVAFTIDYFEDRRR